MNSPGCSTMGHRKLVVSPVKYTVQVMERDNRKLFARVKIYCGSRGITLRTVAKTVAALPPTMITRKKDRGNFAS